MTEWVKGMTVDKAMELKNSQIAEELNLPPVKIHCSVLAEDAIKAAIADYKEKRDEGASRRRRRPASAIRSSATPVERSEQKAAGEQFTVD